MIFMNEEIDLVKLEQATFRIANQDGITEFWMGLMITAIAFLMIETISVVIIAILVVFQAVYIEKIKAKFTYPRIGKVKLRGENEMPSGYGWVLTIFIILPAIASVIFVSRYENDILLLIARWAPLLFGIGLMQPAAYFVERSGLNRYYGIGVVSILLGLVFSLLDFITPVDRMALYMILVGILFILAGLTNLIRFVRKYPILDLEEVSDEQD